MARRGSDPDLESVLASDPLEGNHTNGFKPASASSRQSRRSSPSSFLSALLPGFMTSRGSSNDLKPPAVHASTLYLDGLRGYASICVLNSHVVTAFTNAPQCDWGWGKDEFLTPTNLPVIRLLFSGPGMVTLFFIISGFSCCLKPLEAMASTDPGAHGKVLRNLSTSLLRRWFRLFLPVLACTLLVTIFVHLGGFRSMDYFMGDPNLLHEPQRFIKQEASLYAQFKVWFDDMYELLNIWHVWPNGQPDTGYYAPFTNPHMWFITVEYKASLILYCSLLLLAMARPTQRFMALAAFALFMFFCGKDEILPYFVGGCLAHIKLTIDAQRSISYGGSSEYEKTASNHWGAIPQALRPFIYDNTRGLPRVVWTVVMFLSLWLMSTPAWTFHGPSYFVFTLIVPSAFVRQQTLMQLIGVAGLLLCLMTSTPSSLIRRFLTTPFALYLGRISFAIYIIHGPVLLAVGYAVPVAIWRTFGNGPIPWLAGVVLCEAVTIVLSIWLADIFNRQVESRCVKLTKAIEMQMTGGK